MPILPEADVIFIETRLTDIAKWADELSQKAEEQLANPNIPQEVKDEEIANYKRMADGFMGGAIVLKRTLSD